MEPRGEAGIASRGTVLSPENADWTQAIEVARGTIRWLADWVLATGEPAMREDESSPPFVYEGLDPAREPKSALAEVSEALREAVDRLTNAVDAGRKPGMPLSILSNIAREAPLGSLLVAFLLGVAVGRRR